MTAGPIIWLHHCCGIGMLLSFTCFDFFHSFNADQLVWQFYTYIIVRSIRIENCSRNRCVYTDDLTPWDLKGSPVKTGEKGLCRGGRGVEHYQINVVCQNDPLNLKNGVITTQRSLDTPFFYTSAFSPVKTGKKGETGVYQGSRALPNQCCVQRW